MIDFDFPRCDGQTLTVVWAIPAGTDFGPYVAMRNHNTGEYHVIDPRNITWLFKTPKWLMWGSMLGALVVNADGLSQFVPNAPGRNSPPHRSES